MSKKILLTVLYVMALSNFSNAQEYSLEKIMSLQHSSPPKRESLILTDGFIFLGIQNGAKMYKNNRNNLIMMGKDRIVYQYATQNTYSAAITEAEKLGFKYISDEEDKTSIGLVEHLYQRVYDLKIQQLAFAYIKLQSKTTYTVSYMYQSFTK